MNLYTAFRSEPRNRYGAPLFPGQVGHQAVSAGLTAGRGTPIVEGVRAAASALHDAEQPYVRPASGRVVNGVPDPWFSDEPPAPGPRTFTSINGPVAGQAAPSPEPTTPVITPPGDGSGPPDGPVDHDTRNWQLGDNPRIQRLQALGAGAATVGKALGALAVPAALALPALASSSDAEQQYGTAGGAVAGAGTLAGGVGGMMLGGELGRVAIPPGHRFSGIAAKIGAALGALGGAGVGGAVAGGLNTAAKGAVDRYSAGAEGLTADLGGALNALGYLSPQDLEQRQINQVRNSPTYILAQQQQEALRQQQRAQMIEQLYYSSLARGV